MELKGKVIDFLGDSITEGVGVTDRANNRFDNRLKKMCELKEVHNYGIGGTRLAHQSTPSEKPRHDLCFCGRAYDLDKDADIIVVFGGTNDYGHGDAFFGSLGDKTPATFCGAVWFLMNFLKAEYANKTIVFMTPAHRVKDTEIPKRQEKQADSKPLVAYVNIIEETAKQFDIPVLNLYENLGIDPNIPEQCAKYTTDGLHFNDAGHEYIATVLMNFLKEL